MIFRSLAFTIILITAHTSEVAADKAAHSCARSGLLDMSGVVKSARAAGFDLATRRQALKIEIAKHIDLPELTRLSAKRDWKIWGDKKRESKTADAHTILTALVFRFIDDIDLSTLEFGNVVTRNIRGTGSFRIVEGQTFMKIDPEKKPLAEETKPWKFALWLKKEDCVAVDMEVEGLMLSVSLSNQIQDQ